MESNTLKGSGRLPQSPAIHPVLGGLAAMTAYALFLCTAIMQQLQCAPLANLPTFSTLAACEQYRERTHNKPQFVCMKRQTGGFTISH